MSADSVGEVREIRPHEPAPAGMVVAHGGQGSTWEERSMSVGRALLLDKSAEGVVFGCVFVFVFVALWAKRGDDFGFILVYPGGVWGRRVFPGYLDPQAPTSPSKPRVSRRE